MSSRIVLNSNNLWLLGWTDRTITVVDPGRDLNIHDIPNTIGDSRLVGRVGTTANSTHRELEVNGVVFSGQNLGDLSLEILNHQVLVNREGFMIMYFNVGAPNMFLIVPGRPRISLIRRLNDLFDWSKYGVPVSTPVETAWDRFQLNNGSLMVGSGGGKKAAEELAEAKRQLEENEKKRAEEVEKLKENERRMAEEIRKLKENEKRIEEEMKKKDDRIKSLNAAIAALID